MKFGVVVFPGSNCDADALHVAEHVLGQPTVALWHKEKDLKGCDAIIVPGGFSYGDYLRCGAIARFSPVMEAVAAHAAKGGYVMGFCNGFQILTEAGLLPGALLRNKSLSFICDTTPLEVVTANTAWSRGMKAGQTINLPIAHAEGAYFIDDDGLKKLQDNDQIVFRYRENPNGAKADIAGIVNEKRNVLGMMPHPERAAEPLLGNTDGLHLFRSLLG